MISNASRAFHRTPPTRPTLPLTVAALLLGGVVGLWTHGAEAADKGNAFRFIFDQEQYRPPRKKRGKKGKKGEPEAPAAKKDTPPVPKDRAWPKHTEAFIVARNPKKMRPLYMYGKNDAGAIELNFDDAGGLAAGYVITSKGTAAIRMGRYSVTRALDAPRIAATDWVKADPHPEVVVTINSLGNWKDKNNNMKKILGFRAGPKLGEKEKIIVALFSATAKGTIEANGKKAPFSAPMTVTFRDANLYWVMGVTCPIKVKGKALGLTGEDAEAELTFLTRTLAYSEPPKAMRAPKNAGDMSIDDMDLDIGLD